jgi:hypothetical protein
MDSRRRLDIFNAEAGKILGVYARTTKDVGLAAEFPTDFLIEFEELPVQIDRRTRVRKKKTGLIYVCRDLPPNKIAEKPLSVSDAGTGGITPGIDPPST